MLFSIAAGLRKNAGKYGLALTAVILLSAYVVFAHPSKRLQDPYERPYKVETVRFAGGTGVTLAGELTMPRSGGPFRAIILISGSGPQDRNEALLGHRPFLVLSDYLTRAGYAVLRYDDRGFEQSTGSYEDAALKDFADDAAGAYRYLESRPEINTAEIGFLGHSEGGYIAPFAARQVNPAFMVFLAGGARPLLPDLLSTQVADLIRAEGGTQADVTLATRQIEQASKILAQPVPLEEIRHKLDAYLKEQGIVETTREIYLDQFATPWGVGYANYDPVTTLRAVSVPVFALFGEKDLQVSAEHEAPVMRAALSHPQSQVEIIGGVNHLFQPATTGLPSEYAEINITIAPAVLERITTWLDTL